VTIGAAAGGPFNIAQSLPQIAPRFAEVGFTCTSFETHNLSHRSVSIQGSAGDEKDSSGECADSAVRRHYRYAR
jgi:hypothetical protein